MQRLAIVITHPIQYYAPLFQLITKRNVITLKVFYTWGEGSQTKYDPGFQKNIAWDIPLLENYDFEWVENTAKEPGSHHFKGIVNPTLIQHIKSFDPNCILIFGWAYHSHLKAIRYFEKKYQFTLGGILPCSMSGQG